MDPLQLAVTEVFHPHRPAVLDQHPVGQGLGQHFQVRPAHGRMQIGARGRRPVPLGVDVHLALGEALRQFGVDVLADRIAGVAGGLDQRIVQQLAGVDRRHVQGAGAAVVLARAAPAGLHLLEVGQHVGVAPAVVPHLPPGVVVQRVAAHEEHAVDRRRAAQHLAARQPDATVVQLRLGLGHVAPVELGVEHGPQEADRHLEIEVVVLAPGLQHQDLDVLVLAEPRGQHAAGRAGADDDVVVGLCLGHGGLGKGAGYRLQREFMTPAPPSRRTGCRPG